MPRVPAINPISGIVSSDVFISGLPCASMDKGRHCLAGSSGTQEFACRIHRESDNRRNEAPQAIRGDSRRSSTESAAPGLNAADGGVLGLLNAILPCWSITYRRDEATE